MSCDTEKEVVILYINHNSFKLLKISRAGKFCFQGLLHRQQCSGKQVQVLEYECSLNKVPVRKRQVQILRSEYNNFITVLQ